MDSYFDRFRDVQKISVSFLIIVLESQQIVNRSYLQTYFQRSASDLYEKFMTKGYKNIYEKKYLDIVVNQDKYTEDKDHIDLYLQKLYVGTSDICIIAILSHGNYGSYCSVAYKNNTLLILQPQFMFKHAKFYRTKKILLIASCCYAENYLQYIRKLPIPKSYIGCIASSLKNQTDWTTNCDNHEKCKLFLISQITQKKCPGQKKGVPNGIKQPTIVTYSADNAIINNIEEFKRISILNSQNQILIQIPNIKISSNFEKNFSFQQKGQAYFHNSQPIKLITQTSIFKYKQTQVLIYVCQIQDKMFGTIECIGKFYYQGWLKKVIENGYPKYLMDGLGRIVFPNSKMSYTGYFKDSKLSNQFSYSTLFNDKCKDITPIFIEWDSSQSKFLVDQKSWVDHCYLGQFKYNFQNKHLICDFGIIQKVNKAKQFKLHFKHPYENIPEFIIDHNLQSYSLRFMTSAVNQMTQQQYQIYKNNEQKQYFLVRQRKQDDGLSLTFTLKLQNREPEIVRIKNYYQYFQSQPFATFFEKQKNLQSMYRCQFLNIRAESDRQILNPQNQEKSGSILKKQICKQSRDKFFKNSFKEQVFRNRLQAKKSGEFYKYRAKLIKKTPKIEKQILKHKRTL